MPDTGNPIDTSSNKTGLDPLTAVRLVWAMTGGFPTSSLLKDTASQEPDTVKPGASQEPNAAKPGTSKGSDTAKSGASKGSDTAKTEESNGVDGNAQGAEKLFNAILLPEKYQTDEEKVYITRSAVAMRATLRNLRTIYNGRELNFKENNTLREAYLDSIEESIKFGNDLRDYLKTVPTTIITTLSGFGISVLTLTILGMPIDTTFVGIVVILAGLLGFLISWIAKKYGNSRTFEGLVLQEFERDIYFEHYLHRCHKQLLNLYGELNEIHDTVFKTDFAHPKSEEAKTKKSNEEEEIKNLFNALRPGYCPNIDRCTLEHSYRPDRWAICETALATTCRNYISQSTPPDSNSTEADKQETQGRKSPWPPNSPEECPYKTFSTPKAPINAIIALAGIVLIWMLFNLLFYPPASSVTLVKSPLFQAVEENQTLNVSVALTNLYEDEITHIFIEDEIPEGFSIIEGSITRSSESIELGNTEYLNYTLKASQAGTFNISPVKAFYLDSRGLFQEITSDACLYKVPAASLSKPVARVSKSVDPSVAVENQTLVVLVTIENTGTNDISNIFLKDVETEFFPVEKGITSKNISRMKPSEVRQIQYSINATEKGNFTLNRAMAQFENQTIYSNSPQVLVVGGEK